MARGAGAELGAPRRLLSKPLPPFPGGGHEGKRVLWEKVSLPSRSCTSRARRGQELRLERSTPFGLEGKVPWEFVTLQPIVTGVCQVQRCQGRCSSVPERGAQRSAGSAREGLSASPPGLPCVSRSSRLCLVSFGYWEGS